MYSAASPDELAFVRTAAHQGFVFEANAPKALICKVDGRPVTYDVLHVLEFNSDRKRSSVVARERHELALAVLDALHRRLVVPPVLDQLVVAQPAVALWCARV